MTSTGNNNSFPTGYERYERIDRINLTDTNDDVNHNYTEITEIRPKVVMDPLFPFHMQYHIYGYPIILVLGSLGNGLVYFVFTRTRLRKVSSIQYLAGICITDFGFLWTFIFNPLYAYHDVPVIVQDGVCPFMMLLNYVFTFLSIWYLVAMTTDTFIAVFWPLKKASMCTPFRAKLVMSFLAVLAVASYSYIGYFLGPDKLQGRYQCIPWAELQVHFDNLSKIDTVVVAVVPYGTIIVMTTLIIIRGCEYYRISAAVDLWPRQTGNGSPHTYAAMNVTSIFLPVLIITVLSNLPVMILRTVISVFGVQTRTLGQWNQFFYEFYILNFSLKFSVYFAFSRGFRRRTYDLLKSGINRIKHACDDDSVCDSPPQRIYLQDLPKDDNAGIRLME